MFEPDTKSLNNITNDTVSDTGSVNNYNNTCSYNNASNNGGHGELKSQIISKFCSTSSFIYGIVSERKCRHDYEDLDKIQTNHLAISSNSLFSNNDFSLNQSNDNCNNFKNNIKNDINDKLSSNQNRNNKQIKTIENNYLKTKIINNNKKNFYLLIYVFFYLSYLLFGGFTFNLLESPAEQKAREIFYEIKMNFLKKYSEISVEDLDNFLTEVIEAKNLGISPLRSISNESNWTFGQSLFFSSTVVTTIGYGHVTPLSQTGKIFCMIYASLGIPLTLVLLNAIVERLLVPANWLLEALNTKLGHSCQPFNIRLLHLVLIGTFVGIIVFVIPTVVFAYLEPSWGIMDAFYYCFISMTTVGLGDYVPGEGVGVENQSFYKICITVYLLTGLVAMMTSITVFYDIPQLNLGKFFKDENLTTNETKNLRLFDKNDTKSSSTTGLYIPQFDDSVLEFDEQPLPLHRNMRHH